MNGPDCLHDQVECCVGQLPTWDDAPGYGEVRLTAFVGDGAISWLKAKCSFNRAAISTGSSAIVLFASRSAVGCDRIQVVKN